MPPRLSSGKPLGVWTRCSLRRARTCERLTSQSRFIQISSTPCASSPSISGDLLSPESTTNSPADIPDARFEVLGAPYSLLSVSLSASQPLYTRRGTLVAATGKAENAVSTLSILKPFQRAALGIPFLYQKITSTSPLTALLSTQSPITSFTVLHLNGTIDWIVAQRKALLAWTGHSLSIRPILGTSFRLSRWGNSEITGRGLIALVGQGQIYQITLKTGEEFVAHPRNVVAYTATKFPPLPYRFKHSTLRLQIPGFPISRLIPDTKFFRDMRDTETWKNITRWYFKFRTWARTTIWGDRLFLRFQGPSTILLQSRASRMADVLTDRDVNEIADSPAGSAAKAVTLVERTGAEEEARSAVPPPSSNAALPTKLSVASVTGDGKVAFKTATDFRSLKS